MFANDVAAPLVGGVSSRGALQQHFEDGALERSPGEFVIQLTGLKCEGLPMN